MIIVSFSKAFENSSQKNFRPDVDDVILFLLLGNGTYKSLKNQIKLVDVFTTMKNFSIVGLVGNEKNSLRLDVKHRSSPQQDFEHILSDNLEEVVDKIVDAFCASPGESP